MIFKVVRQGDYIICRPAWMLSGDPIKYFYRYTTLYVFRANGAIQGGVACIDKACRL